MLSRSQSAKGWASISHQQRPPSLGKLERLNTRPLMYGANAAEAHLLVDLAIWSMSSVDVFVQRMAEGLHTASSSLNIFFFRPMFSNTASTICVVKAAAEAEP